MANRTDWTIKGRELANCNCDYGCPCQFNALPTKGDCKAVVGFIIDEGRHGDVSLDGLRAVAIYAWPKAVHQGNGTMKLIIDQRADGKQRAALERILTGEDTDDMATMWWVFSKMSPNKLPTEVAAIDIGCDVDKRVGHIRVAGKIETGVEPIRNPVTGDQHRARINLPHGFEYRVAEIASGTSKVTGDLAMQLSGSHSHMVQMAFNQSGVIA
jgi:hypothetical protein